MLTELSCQSLKSKSFATEKVLKGLSAFLLRVYSHSVEKTSICLRNVQPAIKDMLSINDDNLEREISDTWKTVVGLFKKLQKNLNYDLLDCYRPVIVLAMMHLNKEISSITFSILDLKNNLDEKSKSVSFGYLIIS